MTHSAKHVIFPHTSLNFKAVQEIKIYLWNKGDWFPSSSCSCCSTNAMNIIFAICWPKNQLDCAQINLFRLGSSSERTCDRNNFWIFYNLHVIIYNTIDVWNIETTSGHIRAYQNTSWFSLESTQSSQSFLLTHLSMPKNMLATYVFSWISRNIQNYP